MKKIHRLVFILILAVFMAGCHSSEMNDREYRAEINAWHKNRLDELTAKDGWLTLAGLFWLNPGANNFGSAADNDVIFPEGQAPGHIGTFILEDGHVRVSIKPGVLVTANGHSVSEMNLEADNSENLTILHLGSLSWYVIKRSGQLGVRLKDSTNTVRQNFKGIERYPINKDWRIKATFVPSESPDTVMIPSYTGRPQHAVVPGKLIAQIQGKPYALLPILETPDSEKWFLVFGDKTNGKTTYNGGRFLYVDIVRGGQSTYVDFNKAYNPPCAFTQFATCPLPPPQNKMDIAIEAGEKSYLGGTSHTESDS